MANTTRTQVTRENTEFYDRALLERVNALFLHQKFAQIRDLPKSPGTNVIKFRRYGNLSAATTPLTEGTTPGGSQLSITDVSATYAQYGDYVTITDVLDFESKDPILTETAMILGDQAGDTLDQLTRDVLVACTQVRYGGTATSVGTVAAGDLITVALVQKTVRDLKNTNTRKLTMMVDPSTGYATSPIQQCFVGIVHPNVGYTLKGLTGWTSVEKYASTAKIMEGEIGALDEVRFIESTNAKVRTGAGAAGIDVYCTLILGANAYGVTRVSGEAMKNIVKPLGSAGSADPLEQRATSGWKATFVAKILNNNFLARIETAVAA